MDLVMLLGGITLMMMVGALILAVKSFRKKTDIGKWLGYLFAVSIVVGISYICSILIKQYFWASVFSSIYFISVDMLVVCLLRFTHVFTRIYSEQTQKRFAYIVYSYFMFDMVVFLINPFQEIAVHYHQVFWEGYSKYEYDMKMLFWMHLIFTYIIVLCSLILMIMKAMRAPAGYRRQFCLAVGGILAVVAVNAIFLYLPEDSWLSFLDYSIWGYSIAGFFLYWICFNYSANGMMNVIRNWTLEAVDQGIVLFDYKDQLILINEKARKQLPVNAIKENGYFEDFIQECKLIYMPERAKMEFSYQFYVTRENTEYPVRYDYRPMLNEKGQLIGRLLVFTNASNEKDLLTGFMSWESFLDSVDSSGSVYTLHRSIAVCDINNLSEINSRYGRNVGDQAISKLAAAMKQSFPENTLFVRGNDASLIALCVSKKEEETYNFLTNTLTMFSETAGFDFQINAQGAVCVLEEESIFDGVKKALRGMRSRKLMDEKSHHSSLMNSLMRALEECDPDTSDHVRRTQILGERLGKRLGLKDVEQSSLSLLCMLHDIGKIGVPLDILNKPGKLTEAEWDVIQSHAEKGYQIAMGSDELMVIADMIRHHHERWDGNGYPNGLSKESIPLLSRVIAVVDAYDAMIHNRAYRKAMSKSEALLELSRNAGTQFDPRIVAQLIELIKEDMHLQGEDAKAAMPKGGRTLSDENRSAGAMSEAAEAIPKSSLQSSSQVHEVTYSRYILNDQESIVDADDNFTLMTGYTKEDWEQNEITQFDLIFPEDRKEYFKRIQELIRLNGIAYMEHRIRKKDGSALYVYCFGKTFYSSGNRAQRVEIIISDVTRTYAVQTMLNNEQKKAKERLKHWEIKYRCDSLTGLLTHEAFRNDVEVHLLEQTNKILYLIMDVDYFKQYNDTYGHRKGDEFLINVAQMIMSQLRAKDLVCRLGGDEFVAALFFDTDTPNEVLIERAKKIYSKINMSLTQSEGHASLSMGAAISEQIEKCSYIQLYEAADQALYESKKQGRARMTFYEKSKAIEESSEM